MLIDIDHSRTVFSVNNDGRAQNITLSFVIFHLVPANTVDQVYAWVTNNQATAKLTVVGFGDTAAAHQIYENVAAGSTVAILEGAVLDGGITGQNITIKSLTSANHTSVFGYINRIKDIGIQ